MIQADIELNTKSHAENRLEDAGRIFQVTFGLCLRDNTPNFEASKKRWTLHICNQLFRIYFAVIKQ